MKRILLSFFTLLMFVQVFAQVQRKPLIEEFSNASCAPCAQQNPAFNALLAPNKENVISLKYQVSFPGFDPMNQQNPVEVNNRRLFYGINGVPTATLDGAIPTIAYGGGIGGWNANYAGGPYGFNQAVLDYASAQETFVTIAITHDLSPDLTTANVIVTVGNTGATDISLPNLKLMLALVEDEIRFPTPPGNTNEKDFFGVMRKMIPNESGTSISLIAGEEIELEFTVEIPEYIYDFRQVNFIAFVQDLSSKLVYQSEKSTSVEIENQIDIAAISNTTKPSGYCDDIVIPSFRITNKSEEIVTIVELLYTIGETDYNITWEGELALDESADIEGEEVQVSAGITNITYEIVSVNEGRDVNRMNNLLPGEVVRTFGQGVAGETIEIDFEAIPNFGVPENTILEANSAFDLAIIDQNELSSATWRIGAFEQSDKAMLANCFNMLNNVTASFVMNKIDMTTLVNYTLKFDYAYAQYQSENDRLIVEVSTNCGSTWTGLFNKAGTALSTRTATTAFFVPRSSEWKSEIIDLSAYDGSEELMVRFRIVSAYGNNIWLDNIEVIGETNSTKIDLLDDARVIVFPNPVQNDLNIQLSFENNTTASLYLMDLSGKTIATLAQNMSVNNAVSNYNFKVNQPNGMYFLRVITPEGEITKKINIIK